MNLLFMFCKLNLKIYIFIIKKMKNNKNDKLKNIIDRNLSKTDFVVSDFKKIQQQAINPNKQIKIKIYNTNKAIF